MKTLLVKALRNAVRLLFAGSVIVLMAYVLALGFQSISDWALRGAREFIQERVHQCAFAMPTNC
jgi:hypothetical protein